MKKILFLLLFPIAVQAQQYQIVLTKGQVHFLDSLHAVYRPYLNANHVDYQPVALRDTTLWILPTAILSDTSFSKVYQAIIGAGDGPKIIIRQVADSEYVKPKIPGQ